MEHVLNVILHLKEFLKMEHVFSVYNPLITLIIHVKNAPIVAKHAKMNLIVLVV